MMHEADMVVYRCVILAAVLFGTLGCLAGWGLLAIAGIAILGAFVAYVSMYAGILLVMTLLEEGENP